MHCAGDKALRQILDDARKIADRCTNRGDRDAIMKSVGDIESMANALSELRQQGKVRAVFKPQIRTYLFSQSSTVEPVPATTC